ncbi:MAG TPA: nucleotide exchange factor GrpE [Gemmatimonadales bacterium]|jgi:molecular chaperone GrpE
MREDQPPRDPTEKPDSLPADPRPLPDDWDAADSATAAEAAQAVAQAEDRLLRLAAEYDNYRKRTAKEKSEAFDRGATSLVARLLDVLDDIDRLGTSDPAATSYESFRSAFDVVQRKLRKELETAGLERIDPAGHVFDPTLHEAVAAIAPETPEQDHTVKATFQAGYRFKGGVIRPARVQVYSAHGVA